MGRRPAVIFDIDGTLSSCAWRRHFVEVKFHQRKDWASFHAGIPFDAPVPNIVALLRSIRPGVTRIITTGRTSKYGQATRQWLQKHEIPFDLLLMRSSKDMRIDSDVKMELYMNHIDPDYDVKLVVDDRLQVVRMWKDKLNLKVIRVEDPAIQPRILTDASLRVALACAGKYRRELENEIS